MLRELVEFQNEGVQKFQVMLLRNDSSKQVEIHEEIEVDFARVQEHLRNGGSVFITSKPSQKITPPHVGGQRVHRRHPIRTVTAFYFNHV